jgi:hypothetical protein
MRRDHDMGWTAAVTTLRGRCDGLDPGRSALGGPVGSDFKEGTRPHRGPWMQRTRPAQGRQRSDLQELWWARQGLNL